MSIDSITKSTVDSLDGLKEVVLNSGEYSITGTGLPYSFYFHRDNTSKKLIVMFPGAIPRGKKDIPDYQRISWAKEISGNVLYLQDPTHFLDKSISIGWFQGCETYNPLDEGVSIIKNVLKNLDVSTKDLFFFGSSAGGFSALMFGGYFKHSTLIVNNAQTNVLKYNEIHVKRFLKYGFNSIDYEKYTENYSHRIQPMLVYSAQKYVPNIHYYQNLADDTHYKNHTISFVDEVNSLKASIGSESIFKITFYFDAVTGHSPMPKQKTIRVLNKILAGGCND